MAVFMVHEALLERTNLLEDGETPIREPTIPTRLMNNRTSFSGYVMSFIHGTTSTLVVYYLATYFQGAKEDSAIRSGVLLFPTACVVAPVAIVVGFTIERSGKYMPQTYIAWPLCMVGFGLMAILNSGSSLAAEESFQVVLAVGLGILYVSLQYSVLAPLSVKDNASALALEAWFRELGQ